MTAMRIGLVFGLACLLSLGQMPCARALQFSQIQVSGTEAILGGRGPIIDGDTERLRAAVAGVSPVLRLLGLALDSAGGSVSEARQLGGMISAARLPVIVPHSAVCASACFMLLAASPRRLAADDSMIGVHSAAEGGAETDTSLAATTLMARDAADLGVPPGIIGKMVETTPGRIERLNLQDLASMNVTVFSGDLLTALHQADQFPGRRVLAGAPGLVPPARPNAPAIAGLAAGRNDRTSWDAWLASLRGPYRDGALSARDRMNNSVSVDCSGAGVLTRGDFFSGCEAARQRLAPVVVRLRADAEYAAGWNGLVSPVAGGEPVEQEYQGVYFCTGRVVHLTLKVYPRSREPRRRALLLFGPNASSPDVPHGAFLVEGVIEPAAGQIKLVPVKWIMQPAGYSWLGLSGQSADGGKTYRGRVTGSNACTQFTMERGTAD
jgi:hypothetical protein